MANWECPQEWSEWMKWLAVGLHGRCRWRLPSCSWASSLPADRVPWPVGCGQRGSVAASAVITTLSPPWDASPNPWARNSSLCSCRSWPRTAGCCCARRYSQQAVRPEGPGRRHPSQSHARTGRREVRLRPHLDNTVVGRAASAVGDDRVAPVGRTLCATQEHFGPAHTTRLGIPDEVATGRGLGGLGGEDRLAAGKRLWVVADGAYAKRAFLKPLLKLGVVVVSRLRKDAHLNTLPAKLKKGQRRKRGRQRKYGTKRISLAKRAAARRGWKTIECVQYGKQVVKQYKSFLATYRPAYGTIRVVIVQEATGPQVLLLHRSQRQRHRDSGSLRRSGGDRTRLSRPQGDLGCRPAATPQSVGKHRRVSSVPLDALAGGALGVGQVESRNLRPLRFAVGRSQPTPFARRSSQSIAAQRPPTSISVAYPLPRCGWKNRRLRPAVGQAGRVTQSFFRKCRSEHSQIIVTNRKGTRK